MKPNLRPAVLLLILIAGVFVCTTSDANPSQSLKSVPSLTLQERRGKTIYELGKGRTGTEIVARLGDIDVPASTLPCSGCHGFRGEGRTEGGVSAGGLTWANLTGPTGHSHQNRKHKAFNEESVARATKDCVDPSGNRLMVAMPCYQLQPEEMADLMAYLKRLGNYAEPGITETNLIVGSVIPTEGALATTGAAMRAILTAYFEELNTKGGIHQRKIELRFVDMTSDPAVTMANLSKLVENDQAFALVGGVLAGVDNPSVRLVQSRQIPFVGPSTILPEQEGNDYVFYLAPGMNDQMRALVNYAAQKPNLTKSKLVIVYPEVEVARQSAAAIEARAKKLNWNQIERHAFTSGAFTAATIVEKFKTDQASALFFLGSADEASALLKESVLAGWTPSVFLPGFAYRQVSLIPTEFNDKLFLSLPSVPSDVTAAGSAEFLALRQKYKLPEQHVASQIAALAAAKVFVAGATLAGRDLTREKLVSALEGLANFKTDLTPNVTFGPGRRIGALGAYIIAVDAEKKTLMPLQWVEAN
jgi:ABC-type branched-subunit amino acid transport system substrate-binding protein